MIDIKQKKRVIYNEINTENFINFFHKLVQTFQIKFFSF